MVAVRRLAPGRRWVRAPAARRWASAGKILVALALIVLVYQHSLATLMWGLTLQTPLAYLGAVPLIALALAAARGRPPPHEPTFHDRELDWILAVPLLGIAAAVLLLLPAQLSVQYWQWRVDLLSLPFFCTGVVILLFGVRAAWRVRLALLFLFVAWPLPWLVVLDRSISVDLGVTLDALRALVGRLGVAAPVPQSDGSIFAVGPPGHSFEVSVSALCAGSGTTLGFLLVGGALATVLKGPRWRKLGWMVAGMTAAWILNVVRILVIFAVADQFGGRAALTLLHPVLGSVIFIGVTFAMTLLVGRFGLALPWEAAPPPPTLPRTRAVPRIARALLVVVAVSIPLAAADAGFARYSLVTSSLGAPRLASFTDRPTLMPGWSVHEGDRYEWGKQFFGADSTWTRYFYQPARGPVAAVSGRLPEVVADAVDTSDLSSFETYNLRACYHFHGYQFLGTIDLDLPGGIRGQVISFRPPTADTDWTALAWIWPVHSPAGARYERVVLMTPGGTTRMAALTDFSRRVVATQAAAGAEQLMPSRALLPEGP
jgi:exosortase/archaeosortase family protein